MSIFTVFIGGLYALFFLVPFIIVIGDKLHEYLNDKRIKKHNDNKPKPSPLKEMSAEDLLGSLSIYKDYYKRSTGELED